MLEERTLLEAWERVRENQGTAGLDGQSVGSFGEHLLGQLQQLKSEVLAGRYAPRPLRLTQIPKSSGGTRTLAIPAVRDRVLQTALARVIGPTLDAGFDPASYGYRPGRSVAQAIARVAGWRDDGLQHVVDADIEAFFDHIDHSRLLAMLAERLHDAGVCALVDLWLSAVLKGPGISPHLQVCGVPQGSPLSPLLANLYLSGFDHEMRQAGLHLVRYADDFVVLCASAAQAGQALEAVRAALTPLKLQLSARKTRLTTFAEGFVFLGVRFQHNLMEPVQAQARPWLLPAHLPHLPADDAGLAPAPSVLAEPMPAQAHPSEPAAGRVLHSLDEAFEPDDGEALSPEAGLAAHPSDTADGVRLDRAPAALLQSLYVGEPGCWITQEHDRVVVSRNHAVRVSVPLGQLDQIAVMDNAMLSTAVLRRCAQRGVAVAVGGHGTELLTLDRGCLADQELLRAQWRAHDDPALHLLLARQIVAGKLHNSRVVLRRFARRGAMPDLQAQLHAISHLETRLSTANDLSAVRGLEGAAARRYFDGLRTLLPQGVHFPSRQKRPPRDPVNLTLSLGYAVLAHNLHTLVRMEGLNPHMGHLHATAAGSLALVSDLMEEFRAPVVDAVVLTLWRQNALHDTDFEWAAPDSGQPCRLKSAARRLFIQALEHKLQSQFVHPVWNKPMDLRRAMQAQVRHYIRVLLRVDAVYQPLKLR